MTIPEDIKKKIDDEKEKFSPLPSRGKDTTDEEWDFILNHVGAERLSFSMGAEVGYSLCQKEIESRDKEIVNLKKCEEIAIEQKNEWATTCIKKKKEIERLNNHIDKIQEYIAVLEKQIIQLKKLV